jgi:hypothetical protein
VTAHPPAYSESAHRVTTTTSEITATNIRRTVFVVLWWENTKTAVYSNSRSNNSTLSEIM